MKNETTAAKVWGIIYPLLLYFFLDVIIVWAVEAVFSIPVGAEAGGLDSADARAIASVIFLVISIPLFYFLIYKRDYNSYSVSIYKKPWFFALLIVVGALASHGLSGLVSLFIPDNLLGNYDELQNIVFEASPWLVILQTVILAPLSEELLFRGIMYRRMQRAFGGFWAAGLISSFLFGLYHMNLSQGIFAFLFGLLACAVYYRINNLWASVVLHAGGNLLSVLLVYAGFDYSSRTVFIIAIVLSLACAWALYRFLIRPFK